MEKALHVIKMVFSIALCFECRVRHCCKTIILSFQSSIKSFLTSYGNLIRGYAVTTRNWKTLSCSNNLALVVGIRSVLWARLEACVHATMWETVWLTVVLNHGWTRTNGRSINIADGRPAAVAV